MPKITIKLSGEYESFECPKNETFLEAAQEAGVATPFGCTSGSCQACVAVVTKGEFERGEMDSLDDDLIEKNCVLTCQGKPLSEEIELDFDQI